MRFGGAIVVLSMLLCGPDNAGRAADIRVQPVNSGLAYVLAEPMHDEFRWSGSLDAGRALEIHSVNGNVRAERSSSGRVEVLARRHTGSTGGDEVEIRVVEGPRGITICAARQEMVSSPGQYPCEFHPGANAGVQSGSIDFAIRVPSGVRLIARTISGSVEASSLDSDVEVYTVDGSIGVSTARHAVAEAVNGSISAKLGISSWGRPVRFRTVNGTIRLSLPAGVNTDFQAETVSGDIRSDFPLNDRIAPGKLIAAGQIGMGGQDLLLSTVNGSVELVRTHDR